MARIPARVAAVLLGAAAIVGGFLSAAPSAQAPTGTIALTNARVFDGTGRAPIENATVLVVNGKIQEVGPAVKVPAGATRVDARGKTIIPGLINAHGHVDAARNSTEPVREQLLTQLRMYAQYGITTAYSLGSGPNDALEGLKLRDEQERTTLNRARIYSAGLVIADTTPEAARASVDRNVDQKVDIIKIRVDGDDSNPNKMKPEIYRAVIDEAHKKGMRVASHLYYLKDAMGLLEAGTDVIAHSVRDQDVTPAFIAAVKQRNVGYIPTLTREISVFAYETTPTFFSDPFFLKGKSLYGKQVAQLSDPAAQAKVKSSPEAANIKKALVQAKKNLKTLQDAGVAIAMGTDTGANLLGRWQGFFEHMELEQMVEAGLTPTQALVAATSGAAKVMKIDANLGSLQPGKWADFVVLNANPLTDIKNTRQIDSVWIGGHKLQGAAAGQTAQ
ncbi:MAG TPA: amidohydrolase family protein [Vicinamibacterales bacterium]|jgi:imidazolonepropionase-like amidohydrolase